MYCREKKRHKTKTAKVEAGRQRPTQLVGGGGDRESGGREDKTMLKQHPKNI